jgi:thiamine biosynthesis lipoprotein
VGARPPAAERAGGTGTGNTGVSNTGVSNTGPDMSALPWRIGIADPFRPGGLALVVAAVDCAVATSGTAERGAHIVNPRTGRPAAGLASLTVTGRSLALADACATAAFAMGPALARDWLASLDGCEAYAITEAGETWQTAGFAAFIDPG